MNSDKILLNSYLKELRLPTIKREYPSVTRSSVESAASYESFLTQLTEREVQHRREKAIERRLKQAMFPTVKELDGFDFNAVPKLNKKLIADLSKCEYIDNRRNVVFFGPPGLGKTHLAISLGREACRRGKKVRFYTAAKLVNTYREAYDQRQILRLEKQIQRCDLIIIDELGYLPLEKMEAEHLFGFFSQCYEQTSLVITTNLPFSNWPEILAGDERLAGALLDRLTHHLHIVQIEGESYRLDSSKKGKRKGGDQ